MSLLPAALPSLLPAADQATQASLLALPLVLCAVGAVLWPTSLHQTARLKVLVDVGRLQPTERGVGAWSRWGSALPQLLGAAPARWLLPLAAGVAAWLGRLHLLSLAVAVLVALVQGAAARSVIVRRDRRATVAATAAVSLVCAELAAGSRPELALAAAAEAAAGAPEIRRVLSAAAEAARAGEDPSAVLAADEHPLASEAAADPAAGASATSMLAAGMPSVGIGRPDPTLVSLATAWRLSAHTGTALVTVLEKLSDDLQAREASANAVAAAVAGARSSAVLLALLPLVGCGLGAAMGARPWATLTHTPAGQVLGLIGALLDAAGVVWTAKLVRRAGQV